MNTVTGTQIWSGWVFCQSCKNCCFVSVELAKGQDRPTEVECPSCGKTTAVPQ